jgi:hypothetical protein
MNIMESLGSWMPVCFLVFMSLACGVGTLVSASKGDDKSAFQLFWGCVLNVVAAATYYGLGIPAPTPWIWAIQLGLFYGVFIPNLGYVWLVVIVFMQDKE